MRILRMLLMFTIITTSQAKRFANDSDEFLIQGGYRPIDLKKLTKYVVSIRMIPREEAEYGVGHFCAGTIIGNRAILTAAHCMVFPIQGGMIRFEPSLLLVVTGSVYRLKHESDQNYSRAYRVKKIIKHRDFYPITNKHDIALLILKEDILFNEWTQKNNLPVSRPAAGKNCTVVGWGTLFAFGGPMGDAINYADLIISDREFCNAKRERYYEDGMICALSEAKRETDACQGDSGGPLFCDDRVSGIVSFGVGCGLYMEPGYYTNVYHYLDWIARNGTSELGVGWDFGCVALIFQMFLLLI